MPASITAKNNLNDRLNDAPYLDTSFRFKKMQSMLSVTNVEAPSEYQTIPQRYH